MPFSQFWKPKVQAVGVMADGLLRVSASLPMFKTGSFTSHSRTTHVPSVCFCAAVR